MANTVYGPYTSTSWVAGTTALNQTHMNNLETQASDALHGFNSDFVGASFTLSGCAVTGTNGTTTVNIASGVVYTVMTDGTVGRITVGATTQTTSALSSTYHLYVQPDGTFYWSTSNSPQANSAALANVATNGSGQISSITDQRTTNFTIFSGAAGQITLPTLATLSVNGASTLTGLVTLSGGATTTGLLTINANNVNGDWANVINGHDATYHTTMGMGDTSSAFGAGIWAYDQKNGGTIFSGGTKNGISFNGAITGVGGQTTVGTVGVPAIVARAHLTTVSNSSQTSISTYTTPNDGNTHIVRCWMRALVGSGNTNNGSLTGQISYTNPTLGAITVSFIAADLNAPIWSTLSVAKGAEEETIYKGLTCSANSAVTIKYTNGAAGTISDKVSATIELLT